MTRGPSEGPRGASQRARGPHTGVGPGSASPCREAAVLWSSGTTGDSQGAPRVPAEAAWRRRLLSLGGGSLSAHRCDDGIKSHGEVFTMNRRKRPGDKL